MSHKRLRIVILVLATALLAALIFWLAWGNRALTVTRLTVESDQLPAPFPGSALPRSRICTTPSLAQRMRTCWICCGMKTPT